MLKLVYQLHSWTCEVSLSFGLTFRNYSLVTTGIFQLSEILEMLYLVSPYYCINPLKRKEKFRGDCVGDEVV